MRLPSRLGTAIEVAIEGDKRFTRERDPIQYLCVYKTIGRSVFAFERITLNQIVFWLPDMPMVKKIAEESGYKIKHSIPWPERPARENYGRLSSLEYIPQLGDQPLWSVQIKSPSEALLMLSALP